jgi:hypothetical protein
MGGVRYKVMLAFISQRVESERDGEEFECLDVSWLMVVHASEREIERERCRLHADYAAAAAAAAAPIT